MASSTESMHAEEAAPLVGAVPARDGKGKQPKVFLPQLQPRQLTNDPNQMSKAAAASTEAEEDRLILTPEPAAALVVVPLRRRAWGWSLFPRRDFKRIRVGQSLDGDEFDDESFRRKPGYLERLDMDRRLVIECLRHYNSMHLGNEYEPASGEVTQSFHIHNGICWTHGNFVACQKRSGCFSFLPAPRTLFFFELAYINGFNGVVTCTPLDEPVTEAYSVLGFPLWWSTRRSGKLDSVCKTCHRRLIAPHPGIRKVFACGHNNVDKVCEMCYLSSDVLHPYPGEFVFGYHDP
ncbi:hypothetical protein BDA96_01G540400 [Sorghum bicolor]|uniref:DUF3615 domain-containing protein n=1 Tax=Sorghum bicolor TaxID=4558 RepID=A0A921V1S3_SORBI|nr:hypothetical protein BDA96_01G540400 [Sorghum bicolor]